ncbi:MAG: MBL fold metallo-hydrolase [Rhizobiales bacterium]|nr:MBL fold metallo-hydrolase [Hyphomicrobiales bacterium]
MAGQEFSVKFWGVRGSIPSPGPHTAVYGGNTPCIEITCADRCLIFDAGSGIRALGNQIVEAARLQHLELFFTHCHYDHIEGLPFFSPLHSEEFDLTMWSGHRPKPDTQQMVEQYMLKPYFPVGPACFRASVDYREFVPGKQIKLAGGIVVRTTALTHPDGAVGYRVEFDGRSICYVTDTEHIPGRLDQNILKFIKDSNIVIYDAAYDDDDFKKFAGYGHSTWQEGMRLCDAGNVKLYVAFHHRPSASDAHLKAIEGRLKSIRPASLLAREGLILTV